MGLFTRHEKTGTTSEPKSGPKWELTCEDCGFMVRTQNEPELVQVGAGHLRTFHNMEANRDDVLAKARRI